MRVLLRAVAALSIIGWAWTTTLVLWGLIGAHVPRHRLESAAIALAVGLGAMALVPTHGRSTVDLRPRLPAWVLLALAGLAAASVSWSVGLGPLSDDYVLHEWASRGELMPGTWPYWRPLPLAVWGAISGAGGGWAALHAVNILLHAANASLVARLATSCLGPVSGVVAGLAFIAFPAHAEAVAWTAGVFDVMATFGVLLALNAWCLPWGRFGGAPLVIVGFVTGLLSKESAIVLPALLVLVQVSARPRDLTVARWCTLAAVSVISISFVAARVVSSQDVVSHLRRMPGGRYELKELLVRPFSGVVAPFRSDAGVSVDAWIAGLAVLVLVAWLIRTWVSSAGRPEASSEMARAATGVRIGLAWPVLVASPLLLQFYVAPSLEGSRYLYLAVAGLTLLLGAIFSSRSGRVERAVTLAALVALLSAWTLAGFRERQVWRHAAEIRDAVLHSAALAVQAGNCRTLSVQGAPDSFRGAFVFRVGLPQAISAFTNGRPTGNDCVGVWTGTAIRFSVVNRP